MPIGIEMFYERESPMCFQAKPFFQSIGIQIVSALVCFPSYTTLIHSLTCFVLLNSDNGNNFVSECPIYYTRRHPPGCHAATVQGYLHGEGHTISQFTLTLYNSRLPPYPVFLSSAGLPTPSSPLHLYLDLLSPSLSPSRSSPSSLPRPPSSGMPSSSSS